MSGGGSMDNWAIARFLAYSFLVGSIIGAAIGLRKEYRHG